MGFAKPLGAALFACALAAPAHAMTMPAGPANGIETTGDAKVHEIDYRRRHDGSISYVNPYGLVYAPNYYFHRHRQPDVYVKIIIKPETDEQPRRHTRPLIIDLK